MMSKGKEMKHDVLLADDSKTIQKVIELTLTNEPFNLEIANNTDELFQKIEDKKYQIIFLDYNLATDVTGFELSKKIRELNSEIKIMMLFGTFDVVESDLLEEFNINAHVVKPFDSSKFISVCKNLVLDLDDAKANELELSKLDLKTDPKIKSLSKNQIQNIKSDELLNHDDHENQLNDEQWTMTRDNVSFSEKPSSKWSFEVPPVIDGMIKVNNLEFPPVIDQASHQSVTSVIDHATKTILPSNIEEALTDWQRDEGDLINESNEQFWSPDENEKSVSSGNADVDDKKNEFFEMGNQHPILDTESNELVFDDNKKNDFDLGLEHEPTKTSLFLGMKKQVSSESQNFNEESLIQKIIDRLTPHIEEQINLRVKEYIFEFSKHHIDTVAWEVIPDLAENLIRQELQNISKNIIDSKA
jgi:DNA-binding response OmpR family regulator